MSKRLWLGLAMLLVAACAQAGGRGAIRKQIEHSVLITGTIDVDLQGNVASYELDQPDKISEGIREFLGNSIANWRFDIAGAGEHLPADARIRNKMSLRVVAKELESGNYALRFAGSNFRPADPNKDEEVVATRMEAPDYPKDAALQGVSGTVYLIVKVGRGGQVDDVMAEQVNLRAIASNEKQMQRYRDLFANASLKEARAWSFTPPRKGPLAEKEYWVIRVPVDFRLGGNLPEYGEWNSYVAGPRQPNPWLDERSDMGFSPDALAATGGIYMVGGKGLRLITPLQPSS